MTTIDELRFRLIWGLGAIFLCVCVAAYFSKTMLTWLKKPIDGLQLDQGSTDVLHLVIGKDGLIRVGNMELAQNLSKLTNKVIDFTLETSPTQHLIFGNQAKLFYSGPMDPFMMQFKVALIGGLLLSLPFCLYHIWRFIGPGLTPKERRVVKPMLLSALFLFPLGGLFAFFMVHMALTIMRQYGVAGIEPLLDVFKYLSFLTTMMIAFGIIFEMPLVVAIGARIGLIKPKVLVRYRRHTYVVLAVAAAIITPTPDPFTMLLALIPLIILFEISVAICRPMARKHREDDEVAAEPVIASPKDEDFPI